MRRWLPIALLLVLAGLAGFAWLREKPAAEPVPSASAARVVEAAPIAVVESSNALAVSRAVVPEAIATANKQPALLVVSVRGKLARAPLADVRVQVFSGKSTVDYSSSKLDIPEPIGEGRTDSAGQVTLPVPAGELLTIQAQIPTRKWMSESEHLWPGPGAGERAEVEILLPEENDSRVFGQVLAAESNEPLAGAHVELRDNQGAADMGRAAYSTSADGRFEIPFSTWIYPHLRIQAEGRGARLADPAGHDDPARPLIVRLARACTLDVHAHDPAGAPVPGVQVRIEAKCAALDVATTETSGFFMRAYLYAPDETWSAETDVDGHARIAQLPAGVELLSQVVWKKTRTHLEPERLTLEGGEKRSADLLLGGGTRLVGQLLDQDSRPLPNRTILLAVRAADEQQRTLNLASLPLREREKTDSQGRFSFDGLEPGCWLLAPDRADGMLAGMPERVVTSGEREIAVTLHAFRDLYLTGFVLDPDAKRIANARVEAYAANEMFWDDARTGEDGRFRLGPVTSDLFTLLAYGKDGLANSEELLARAGDDRLVLNLEPGGILRGRVVDATSSAACAAQLMYTPERRTFGPFGKGAMMSTEPDGTFEIRGLIQGRYGLAAMSVDGRFGLLSGVEFAAGKAGDELVLALEPGGRLAVHYTGTHPQLYVVATRGGVPVHFGAVLAPDGRATLLAPAGELVLELREDPLGEARKLPVSLAVGATAELEIGD